jgi:uncharacterized protein
VTARQVVIEGGHMVDTPDRPSPRFPPEAEARIDKAIAAVLDGWQVGPGSLVISQGARGTDLLIAEAALHRGADVSLFLALPPDEFEKRSVVLPRSRWVDRFRALKGSPQVQVSEQSAVLGPPAEGESPFARNNDWVIAEGQRQADHGGVPLRALAVWDGEAAEGQGTDHFVEAVRGRGIELRVIDPKVTWRTPNVPYWERQRSPGPKRMLALDGGGLRGLITLEILAQMEGMLGGGKAGFALSDYFDYIGGTSTGAIIAASLARGRRVQEISDMYRAMGPAVFRKRWPPARWWRSRYKDNEITRQLQDFLGATTTLGSDELRSLLLVVMHRVDTDSLWPLSNNTNARYNDRTRDDCNLDYALWKIVRGSTAAPTFFPPEEVQIGGQPRPFEDGGVTPHNNPALLMFEMATSPRYRLGWPIGPENLLLVSVGTGMAAATHEALRRSQMDLLFQAKNLAKVIMNGSSNENDRLCRVLGRTVYAPPLGDREFEAEGVDASSPGEAMFSYVRYNADLSAQGLVGVGSHPIDPKSVAKLDAVSAMGDLIAIGQRAAQQVSLEHFAGFPRPQL